MRTAGGHLGFDRADMPQLSGNTASGYVPSSVMVPKFVDYLRQQGVTVTRKRIDPAGLKPTQTTGEMKAIRRVADQLKSGGLSDTKAITISADNRVLDGHHNWAGRLLANSEGGRQGCRTTCRSYRSG
ncbi:MAG TPA: hypothetical protein VF940_33630 [Streptosporangiaceae bacterium]